MTQGHVSCCLEIVIQALNGNHCHYPHDCLGLRVSDSKEKPSTLSIRQGDGLAQHPRMSISRITSAWQSQAFWSTGLENQRTSFLFLFQAPTSTGGGGWQSIPLDLSDIATLCYNLPTCIWSLPKRKTLFISCIAASLIFKGHAYLGTICGNFSFFDLHV